MAAADGTLPELVVPYDNAFAVSNGLANATAEEQEAFWNYAPEGDVMAFVRGEFTTAVKGGDVYVVNPANNVLYATTNFMGLAVVTKATDRVYTNSLDNAGAEFDWGVSTNVVVMHSAVYDFFGYDPTTALPGSETVDAEGNATTVEGANTVPFTRLWKMATEGYYLPEVEPASDLIGKMAAWKTDANGNSLADGYELYLRNVAEKNGVAYTDALAASADGPTAAPPRRSR